MKDENKNTRFVRYKDGAALYSMCQAKFERLAKDANAIYMKVPKDFEPACMSMTEDDHEEFLRWIDVSDPIKFYPEFFRTELLHPIEGVKHFVTDERPRED